MLCKNKKIASIQSLTPSLNLTQTLTLALSLTLIQTQTQNLTHTLMIILKNKEDLSSAYSLVSYSLYGFFLK